MNNLDATEISLDHARTALTASGAPYEMAEVTIRGIVTRVWKNVPATLGELAREARQHRERLFTVYEDERVTYEASFRASATLAIWLSAQGIGKGDRVALVMRNLPEWPVIFFAVTSLGAIAVPLNAWWTGQELTHGLADSGASVAFCDAERAQRLGAYLPSLQGLRTVVVTRPTAPPTFPAVALEDLIGHPSQYASLPPAALPEARVVADDAATIFYTSGTTDVPKGSLGTHRNILTHILTSRYATARNLLRAGKPLPPATPRVRLITVPLFHVTGCAAGLVSGIPAGNTNIYMHKWDARKAMRLIQEERVNIAGGVPTMVWELLDHPDRSAFDFSSLESVAFGGAPASAELARRIRDELGAVPGVGWGMTETMSTVCSVSGADFLAHASSCGLPVPVADIKLLDPTTAVEVPAGEIGELCVKGPMVAAGYWNRPEANAALFIEGWMRTGDLARVDTEGFCSIVDRLKDVIIRGGENIYCAEVESVLGAHPSVAEAALIGMPHRTLGEEPMAIVRNVCGREIGESELQAWVRERLAGFKTPVRIRFVQESLPRNAGGKVLKSALREWLESEPQATTQSRGAA